MLLGLVPDTLILFGFFLLFFHRDFYIDIKVNIFNVIMKL